MLQKNSCSKTFDFYCLIFILYYHLYFCFCTDCLLCSSWLHRGQCHILQSQTGLCDWKSLLRSVNIQYVCRVVIKRPLRLHLTKSPACHRQINESCWHRPSLHRSFQTLNTLHCLLLASNIQAMTTLPVTKVRRQRIAFGSN